MVVVCKKVFRILNFWPIFLFLILTWLYNSIRNISFQKYFWSYRKINGPRNLNIESKISKYIKKFSMLNFISMFLFSVSYIWISLLYGDKFRVVLAVLVLLCYVKTFIIVVKQNLLLNLDFRNVKSIYEMYLSYTFYAHCLLFLFWI